MKKLLPLLALAALAALPSASWGWGSGFGTRVNVRVGGFGGFRSHERFRFRGTGFGGFGERFAFPFSSGGFSFRQGYGFGGFRSFPSYGGFAFRQAFIAPQIIDVPLIVRQRLFVLPELDVSSYSAPSSYSSGCYGSSGYSSGSYGGMAYGGGGYGAPSAMGYAADSAASEFEAGSLGLAPPELAAGFQAGAGFLQGYGSLPLYSRGADTFAFNVRSRTFFKLHHGRHHFRFHHRGRHGW